MDMTEIETYKELLHIRLNFLLQEYRKAAQPILDELIKIEGMTPRPIYFDANDPAAKEIVKLMNGSE